MIKRRFCLLFVGFSVLVGLAPAHATPPDCGTRPNPVYLQVGDTQKPLIKTLGQKLRASTVNPMTLIYAINGSCTNVSAMYTGTKLTTNPKFVPS